MKSNDGRIEMDPSGIFGGGTSRCPCVLLVDDSEDDLELAMLALKALPQRPEVRVARDGVEALMHMRGGDRKPGLVLLDLKMPRMDGVGVLRERRTDEVLRKIPVIVFSTSAADWDIDESYDLGANGYMVKPSEMDRLDAMLGDILRVFCEHLHTSPSLR